MKKLLLSFAAIACFMRLDAQVDFSAQANGALVNFSITQAGNYYEYVIWDFGDGSTSYGQPVAHTYTASGNYSVCVTGYPMPITPPDQKCKMVNVIGVGIQKQNSEHLTRIFPNPVKDKLYLSSSLTETKGLTVSLINALGKTVYSAGKINTIETIDMSQLATGIYFLQIHNDNIQQVIKIVKE